jgi:two-component system, LytTR family, response regulator
MPLKVSRVDYAVTPVSRYALQFLVGQRENRLYPLKVEKIDYIEAKGNYVMIRSDGSDYLRRDSIKHLAPYLAAQGFMRIQRSVLLNARVVAFAQANGHGTFVFTLLSGARLESSTGYRDGILNVLPLAPSSRRKELRSSTGERPITFTGVPPAKK